MKNTVQRRLYTQEHSETPACTIREAAVVHTLEECTLQHKEHVCKLVNQYITLISLLKVYTRSKASTLHSRLVGYILTVYTCLST